MYIFNKEKGLLLDHVIDGCRVKCGMQHLKGCWNGLKLIE